MRMSNLVLGLSLVLLAATILAMSWDKSDDAPAALATTNSARRAPTATPVVFRPDRFDAEVICEQFVTNELKAPSTAKFSGPGEGVTVNNSGNTWTVRGWVDSQNGFGAMIRSDYECRATFTGRSGNNLNWNREALTITGR